MKRKAITAIEFVLAVGTVVVLVAVQRPIQANGCIRFIVFTARKLFHWTDAVFCCGQREDLFLNKLSKYFLEVSTLKFNKIFFISS